MLVNSKRRKEWTRRRRKEEKARRKDACKRVDDPLSTSFVLEAANAEAKEFIRIVVPKRHRERLEPVRGGGASSPIGRGEREGRNLMDKEVEEGECARSDCT